MASDAHDESLDAEPDFPAAADAAIAREFQRILGSELDGGWEGAPAKFFWLLPLTSPAAFVAFLERIPSNAGVAGVEAAVARLAADLQGGGSSQAPDAAG